jgi:NCS1 family nucleobase:cation symporter-1
VFADTDFIVYTWRGTTDWGNHDLYPIDPKERTFGALGFFAIWATNGISVSTITLGSSYVAYGLSAGQTLGSILAGCVISSLIAFLCARPGMDYHIGYTVWNRVAFGLRGQYIPVMVVVIGGMVFVSLLDNWVPP